MTRKPKSGNPAAYNKRAPALPRKGQTTVDNPTTTADNTPPQDCAPHLMDPRSPMENDAAPSRLDFELLRIRAETHEAIIRRLILVLPTSTQAEINTLLDVPSLGVNPEPAPEPKGVTTV